MSVTRTIWLDTQTRQSIAVRRQWSGVVLAAMLLSVMCGAEVLFLNFVAGADAMNLLQAAEGIAISTGD